MSAKQKKPLTSLSTAQTKFLRSIAHNIRPMLMIGGNGLTDGVMTELETTLERHELLKIKISFGEREDRKEIVDHILGQTGALLVQTIGKTCVIFRQREEDSEFNDIPRK